MARAGADSTLLTHVRQVAARTRQRFQLSVRFCFLFSFNFTFLLFAVFNVRQLVYTEYCNNLLTSFTCINVF